MRVRDLKFCKIAFQNYFEDTGYLLLVTAHWKDGDHSLVSAVNSLIEVKQRKE
jgi:hypothetical protein